MDHLEELTKKMGDFFDGDAKRRAEIEDNFKKAQEGLQKVTDDVALLDARSKRDVALLQASLGTPNAKSGFSGLSPSGIADWQMEMSKFLCAGWHHSRGHSIPESAKMAGGVNVEELVAPKDRKSAANFTTGTSSPYAGYLIPEILRPGIIELRDIYGNLYPRVTKFTAPAGVNINIPRDSANPAWSWVGAQFSNLTEEATPMAWTRDTLNTECAGTYIDISNELINNPSINFGGVATSRIVRAGNRFIETAMLQATDSSAGPGDGVLINSSVNDQGTIATATFDLLSGFLQDSIVDNAWAIDTSNAFFMHPYDVIALAKQPVGVSELTGMLVWGNPRTGIPTTLMGHEVIIHPAMLVSTTYYAALGDPSSIILAEDPTFTVDLNPWGDAAFIANLTRLRVLSHFDWSIGQPTEWHKTVITNA